MAKKNGMDRIQKAKIITRAFPVSFSTLDEKTRSIMATLATENPVRVYDWESGGYIDEILLADGFVFAEQIPLLDCHARWSVKDQLGSIREISVKDRALVGRAFFSEDDESDRVYIKVKGRHLTDLSIGYITEQTVMVKEGSEYKHTDGRIFKGPVKLSLKTTVKEGSVTPIGADEFSKFRSETAGEDVDPERIAALETENRELKANLEAARQAINFLTI